jgi:hypothetical protein
LLLLPTKAPALPLMLLLLLAVACTTLNPKPP